MSEDYTDNLTQVIEDSVNDAVSPEPEVDDIGDTVEVQPETVTPEVTEPPTQSDSTAVTSPNQQTEETQTDEQQDVDEFAKLAGISQMGVTGRENRIPYSRVKKITEKAVGDVAEAVLGRKLNPGEKAVDVVKQHVAQIPQLQNQVKDYETRLETVGQFEDIMVNDPTQFLTKLSQLPAYQQFFQFVENAYNALQAGYYQQPPTGVPAQGQPPAQTEDAMPEPDETLTDGSKVYSLDGLKKLLAWNAKQVEGRVSNQFEQRYKALEDQYKPIKQAWDNNARVQAVLPVIRQQIAEARTWPMFNENEDEITKALQADRNLTLEAAYRKVVFPKMVAERNNIRQSVIKELQQAPAATAVSGRAVKPVAPAEGPRSLEDIIKEQLDQIR